MSAENLTSKELRMDAYYYSFGSTGVPEVDLILSAVACAGKAFHHTESWSDECEWEPHDGNCPIEWIYNAAVKAAEEIKKLQHELEVAKLGRAAAAQALAEEWQKQAPAPEPGALVTQQEFETLQREYQKLAETHAAQYERFCGLRERYEAVLKEYSELQKRTAPPPGASALAKRTSMVECAGGGSEPRLEITFASLDDMHAASDFIRSALTKEVSR
jgi:hypothetical protein